MNVRMPSRAVVEAFIATIERGEFLEALPKFYAEDMIAQENNAPPASAAPRKLRMKKPR